MKRGRLGRFFDEDARIWLPTGIVGGAAGGCAVAWLLWGSPHLLSGTLCFPISALVLLLLYAIACAGGCSLILTVRMLARAIRQLTRPPSPYMAVLEPPETFPELNLVSWPHPGCGLIIYVPIIAVSAAAALPWFWLAFREVAPGRLLIAIALGLPLGIVMARREHTAQKSD